MTFRIKETSVNALLVLSSLLLSVATLEVVGKLYALFWAPPNHEQLRRSRPPPYAKATYYGTNFLRDLFLDQSLIWYTPKQSRLILAHDYRGRYINIDAGLRVTTDQPSKSESRIFLFGGSTMYSGEVPDGHTIPSYLQRRLTESFRNKYKVLNYGVTSVNLAQMFERLKTLKLSRGDLVIFYCGANDLYQGIFYGNPNGTIIGEQRDIATHRNYFYNVISKLAEITDNRSDFIKYFLVRYLNSKTPDHLTNESAMRAIGEQTQKQYVSILDATNGYVKGQGAEFIHFLQPHIYSNAKLSEYERQLSNNYFIVLPGQEEAFRFGNPYLVRAHIMAHEKKIKTFNIQMALEQREQSEEYFLDAVHVTHNANRNIANLIYKTLFGSLPWTSTFESSEAQILDAMYSDKKFESWQELLKNGKLDEKLTSWAKVGSPRFKTFWPFFDFSETALVVTNTNYIYQDVLVSSEKRYVYKLTARCPNDVNEILLQVDWMDKSKRSIASHVLWAMCGTGIETFIDEIQAPKGGSNARIIVKSRTKQPVLVQKVSFRVEI